MVWGPYHNWNRRYSIKVMIYWNLYKFTICDAIGSKAITSEKKRQQRLVVTTREKRSGHNQAHKRCYNR